MSLYQRMHKAHRYIVEREVGKDATAKQVLDHMFGTYDDAHSEYVVYHYNDPYTKPSTVLQRFNRLWVVPLFFICAPFQWLFTGDIGLNDHTKLGEFVHKITGL